MHRAVHPSGALEASSCSGTPAFAASHDEAAHGIGGVHGTCGRAIATGQRVHQDEEGEWEGQSKSASGCDCRLSATEDP